MGGIDEELHLSLFKISFFLVQIDKDDSSHKAENQDQIDKLSPNCEIPRCQHVQFYHLIVYRVLTVAIGTHLYTIMSIRQTSEVKAIVASRIADPFATILSVGNTLVLLSPFFIYNLFPRYTAAIL